MSALYLVIPLALLVAGAAVIAFAWVVRSGQLDDCDTPARRILFEDAPSPGAGVRDGEPTRDAAAR